MRIKFWLNEDPEAQAREKQKKLDYSVMLQQQIEEKKRQRENDKKRAIEEDIKYQAKYNDTFPNKRKDNTAFIPQIVQEQAAHTTTEPQSKVNYHHIQSTPEIALNSPEPRIPELITLSFIEDLFRMFVEEQIKVISNYERDLDISLAEGHFYSFAENSKAKAINQIHNEKDKLKSKLGFFPLENNYNAKIEELFNKILTKKVHQVSNEPDNEPFHHKIDRIEEIANNIDYKSKYIDDVKTNSAGSSESTPIDWDANLMNEVQQSLIGFSKLVQINKDEEESENFLVTWRDNIIKQQTKRSQLKEESKADCIHHVDPMSYPILYTDANQLKANHRRKLTPIQLNKCSQKEGNREGLEKSSVKHQTISWNNYSNAIIQKYEHENSGTLPLILNKRDKSKNKTMTESKRPLLSHELLNSKLFIPKRKESEAKKSKNINKSPILKGEEDAQQIEQPSSVLIDSNKQDDNKEMDKDKSPLVTDINKEGENEEEEIDTPSKDTDQREKSPSSKDARDVKEPEVPLIVKEASNRKIKSRYYRPMYKEDNPSDKFNPFQNTKEIQKLNAMVNNEIDISESDELRDTYTFHQKKKSHQRIPSEHLHPRNIASASNRKRKSREKELVPSKSKVASSAKRNLIPRHNYRGSQQHSENDSILKELDRFREMALNDIGSADLGNNQLSLSQKKTHGIDLIPKEIIRNYSNVISLGGANDNYP